MICNELYDTLRRDLFVVLLGSNRTSHRLAASLFRRFGTVSVIADRHRGLRDLLNPATVFLSLPASCDPRLCAELLLDTVGSDRDLFPLLVPCTEEYQAMAQKTETLLESRYILCRADSLLTAAPLSELMSQGGLVG